MQNQTASKVRSWVVRPVLWILLVLLAIVGSTFTVILAAAALFDLWYRPTSPLKTKASRIVASSAVGLGLAFALLNADATSTELPTCDSSAAKRAYKRAIENAPREKAYGVVVQDVTGMRQCAREEDSNKQLRQRACQAQSYTSAGSFAVTYIIKWIDQSKGQWWLEPRADCVFYGQPTWRKEQSR